MMEFIYPHTHLVAGVDEVGRGPLVGAVVTAAVILDPARPIIGLNDSKKLSEKRRLALFDEIKEHALAWSLGRAEPHEIDELNILHATGLAMRRAVEALAHPPVHALVDGNYRFKLPCAVTPVVKGDSRSLSIAAASILAKTARDRLMIEMDAVYPGYGFARHKGYNAPIHQTALNTLGPCPAHRRSWAPIKALLEIA